MTALKAVPTQGDQSRVEMIKWHASEGDRKESEVEEHRWEEARLIYEELQSGKSQRALADEIGKSRKHVRDMSATWEHFGGRLSAQPFNTAYNSDAVRGRKSHDHDTTEDREEPVPQPQPESKSRSKDETQPTPSQSPVDTPDLDVEDFTPDIDPDEKEELSEDDKLARDQRKAGERKAEAQAAIGKIGWLAAAHTDYDFHTEIAEHLDEIMEVAKDIKGRLK